MASISWPLAPPAAWFEPASTPPAPTGTRSCSELAPEQAKGVGCCCWPDTELDMEALAAGEMASSERARSSTRCLASAYSVCSWFARPSRPKSERGARVQIGLSARVGGSWC